jgi:hypothetical protein
MSPRVISCILVSGLIGIAGCNLEDQALGPKSSGSTGESSSKAGPPPAPPSDLPTAQAPQRVAADRAFADATERSNAESTEKTAEKETLPAIKLSGAGDQATTKFELHEGLSLWTITHAGRSNVQMSLLSSEGKEVTMPFNEIGRFEGTRIVRVPKTGTYLINVGADGKWTVNIEQPRPTAAAAKPLSAHGNNTNVTPFVTLPKGLVVFKASHKGDGVFRVKIFTRDGKFVDQVVGVVGRYDGSKALTIEEEGIYIVGVSANGDWTVNVD